MTVQAEIFARNLDVDERTRKYVMKKASTLDRYLREIDQVRVDLDYIKSARNANDRFVAQITVKGRKALLRTEERADELTSAFDITIDKMQRQLERYKGKHYRGRGSSRVIPEEVSFPVPMDSEEQTGIISRRKAFELIPMNEAEALEQMRFLGHDNFFIFFNIETVSVNVLYRRRDNSYGLIETKVR